MSCFYGKLRNFGKGDNFALFDDRSSKKLGTFLKMWILFSAIYHMKTTKNVKIMITE